jgi:hypothetical protein
MIGRAVSKSFGAKRSLIRRHSFSLPYFFVRGTSWVAMGKRKKAKAKVLMKESVECSIDSPVCLCGQLVSEACVSMCVHVWEG